MLKASLRVEATDVYGTRLPDEPDFESGRVVYATLVLTLEAQDDLQAVQTALLAHLQDFAGRFEYHPLPSPPVPAPLGRDEEGA